VSPAEAWFIRHGESASNAGLPTTSPGDTPLTDRGLAQARAFAASFPAPPARIVDSPFARAARTADPLAQRFPAAPRATWPVQEFTYLCPERYFGSTNAGRQPAVEAYWKRMDPHFVDGPGAESFTQLLDRLAAALARLAALPGLTAIFTHGNSMRAFLCLLLLGAGPARADPGRSMELMRALRHSLPIANLAVLQVDLAPDGPARLSGFPLEPPATA
jgi:broad specificity phosphatase PhoE